MSQPSVGQSLRGARGARPRAGGVAGCGKEGNGRMGKGMWLWQDGAWVNGDPQAACRGHRWRHRGQPLRMVGEEIKRQDNDSLPLFFSHQRA